MKYFMLVLEISDLISVLVCSLFGICLTGYGIFNLGMFIYTKVKKIWSGKNV